MSTDDLDDPFIARYADRVDDETEVLWRADYDRMFDMRERGFDGETSLFVQADEIEAYWLSDPQVDPHWCDLREIHDGWIQAPEAMKQAHEVFMPGGLRPPGMNQPRWASHMQAREMTGHGYWPGFEPTFSTDVSERHEPMTDTTDRAHILDSETESDIERQMRTDYERAAQSYRGDPDEYDPADALDASDYASTWMEHDDRRYVDEWVAIGEAEELWRTDPDAAAAQLADTSTAPLQRRTLEHARDMSRGIYVRDAEEVIDRVTGTADSSSSLPELPPTTNPLTHFEAGLPSWDASRNDPARPVPTFAASVADRTGAVNAFSNASASVNAFAAVMEREEMER
ncbi:hypothetical protein [Nocardia fluminea]|uniref:hypothetical protein n=1 Tax=Nocardia fluminea TaxID=134984 RepID=UPI0036552EA7